jgi:hypothetical protein
MYTLEVPPPDTGADPGVCAAISPAQPAKANTATMNAKNVFIVYYS